MNVFSIALKFYMNIVVVIVGGCYQVLKVEP